MKIASDTHLLATDRHARISAGPGAGKTFWLVSHIKNVLTRSSKIHHNATIVVISYTNVAADQLREELGVYASRADISSIHSFLYRNVVRPYVHLLRGADGELLVTAALLDGHDEHHVNYQHLTTWLKRRNLQGLTTFQKEQFEMLRQHIATIRWHQGEGLIDWQLELRSNYGLSDRTKAQLIPDSLFAYKAQYWKEGIIDHDDVLYFAFRILENYPIVRDCLSSHLPFIFIDEFQDTVPAQTQIVRWLAEAGTTVVVIGDAEQSIFEFAGASPRHFRDFALPEMDEYEIANNRRSTQTIVGLLNHMRNDGLSQECTRGIAGAPIQLLVGTAVQAAKYARTLLKDAPLIVLARTQDIVNDVMANTDSPADQWSKVIETDPKRGMFLRTICMALILARSRRLEISVAAMLKGIRHAEGLLKDPLKSKSLYSRIDRQAIAVTILEYLVGKGHSLDAMTVRTGYADLSDCLNKHFKGLSLSKITKGAFAELADAVTMRELIGSVRIDNTDEVRDTRTIHKAKGKQADHVLVCLHSTHGDYRLRHLTTPTIPSDEEQRITYVAVSRARDTLFLAVHELSSDDEEVVRALGITVVRFA